MCSRRPLPSPRGRPEFLKKLKTHLLHEIYLLQLRATYGLTFTWWHTIDFLCKLQLHFFCTNAQQNTLRKSGEQTDFVYTEKKSGAPSGSLKEKWVQMVTSALVCEKARVVSWQTSLGMALESKEQNSNHWQPPLKFIICPRTRRYIFFSYWCKVLLTQMYNLFDIFICIFLSECFCKWHASFCDRSNPI